MSAPKKAVRARVMWTRTRPCIVCLKREQTGSWLCDPCAKSYSKIGGTELDAIEWTAKRARYFCNRKARQ